MTNELFDPFFYTVMCPFCGSFAQVFTKECRGIVAINCEDCETTFVYMII